jgi:tetrahydromethanopterin S-methyltransferase subunit B
MKPVKKILIIPLLTMMLFIGSFMQTGAQIPDEVVLSLQSGNAKALAGFFNQNIELVILDNDNIYSKAQAEQIVNNFFNRNQPERFTVRHQRGKEGAHYVIGELVTKQETFRVYFLIMKTGGKDIIHQLRIEKQE